MTYFFSIKKALITQMCDESRAVVNNSSRALTGEYISYFIEGIMENEQSKY